MTSHQWLVSVDPGEHMGFAVFRDGTLWQCGLGGYGLPPGCEFVIEKPCVYPRSKADPNDLITLAVRVGEELGAAKRLGLRTRTVLPREWKRSVSKEIMLDRITAHLAADEREVFAENVVGVARCRVNNVLDAIGIGLFHLGRMRPGGA